MEKYERITDNEQDYYEYNGSPVDIYNKLVELEDKIENGMLKELPENAVVLTREEYDEYQDLLKNFDNYLFEYRKFADGRIKDTRKETAREFVKDLLQELDLVGYDKSDFCVTAVKVVAKKYGVDVE